WLAPGDQFSTDGFHAAAWSPAHLRQRLSCLSSSANPNVRIGDRSRSSECKLRQDRRHFSLARRVVPLCAGSDAALFCTSHTPATIGERPRQTSLRARLHE